VSTLCLIQYANAREFFRGKKSRSLAASYYVGVTGVRTTGMSDDERDDESSEDGDFDPNKVYTHTFLGVASCKCAPMYEVQLVLD
jgi:hypothetical protein